MILRKNISRIFLSITDGCTSRDTKRRTNVPLGITNICSYLTGFEKMGLVTSKMKDKKTRIFFLTKKGKEVKKSLQKAYDIVYFKRGINAEGKVL